jgi:ATP-dependent DNA helicase RecQ
LSAVYRTGQRFGAAHVIDVLLGNATEKIIRNGHDELSVFSIGTEVSQPVWRSVIRQLVVQGYLRVDHERYGALVLTAESRPLLRGEVELGLRHDAKATKARKKPKVSTAIESLSDQNQAQFQALKELRRQIATERGVPPYVIFHDSTLLAMLTHKPETPEQMLEISGVGQKKVEQYGAQFLERLHAIAGSA